MATTSSRKRLIILLAAILFVMVQPSSRAGSSSHGYTGFAVAEYGFEETSAEFGLSPQDNWLFLTDEEIEYYSSTAPVIVWVDTKENTVLLKEYEASSDLWVYRRATIKVLDQSESSSRDRQSGRQTGGSSSTDGSSSGSSGITGNRFSFSSSTFPAEGVCTNYNGLGDLTSPLTGYSPGATIADTRKFQPWHDDSYPGQEFIFLFSNMLTDYYSPDIQQICRYVLWCEERVAPIDIYNFDPGQVNTTGDCGKIQMVVNYVPENGKSCFTVTFPKNFNVQASQRYGVIVSGNGYGMSNNIIFKEYPHEPHMVNKTYNMDYDHLGMVWVQWNCGGTESLGLLDYLQCDLAKVLDLLHREFNCDKDQVVTAGSSRAGGVSLMLAKNPFAYDWTVRACFSSHAPLACGDLSQGRICTNPARSAVYRAIFPPDGDRYSRIPPPASNPAEVLWTLLHTTDVWEGNARSPDGDDDRTPADDIYNFENLDVLINLGADFDAFMDFSAFLEFDRNLCDKEIPHGTIICQDSGHGSGKPCELTQMSLGYLSWLLNGGAPSFDPTIYGLKYGTNDTRTYFRRLDLEQPETNPGAKKKVEVNLDRQPFTAEIPARIGRSVREEEPNYEPMDVHLSGPIGGSFRVELSDDQRQSMQTWTVDFVESESDTIFIPVDGFFEGPDGMNDSIQYLDWKIEYRIPEDDENQWRDMTGCTNHIFNGRLLARTYIDEDQPEGSEYLAFYGLLPNECLGYSMSFGVNEGTVLVADLVCEPVSGTHYQLQAKLLNRWCYDRKLQVIIEKHYPDGYVDLQHHSFNNHCDPDEQLEIVWDEHFHNLHDTPPGGIYTFKAILTDITDPAACVPPFPPGGYWDTETCQVEVTIP